MRDLSTPGIAFSDWKIIAESAYTWPKASCGCGIERYRFLRRNNDESR